MLWSFGHNSLESRLFELSHITRLIAARPVSSLQAAVPGDIYQMHCIGIKLLRTPHTPGVT
jgi:hypothetical protein